jgi:hypothetical protein
MALYWNGYIINYLNNSLFLMINAGPGASGIVVGIARFLAEGLIWILPLGLIVGWLHGSSATRQILIAATVSGCAGLLINRSAWLILDGEHYVVAPLLYLSQALYRTIFAGCIKRGWVRR